MTNVRKQRWKTEKKRATSNLRKTKLYENYEMGKKLNRDDLVYPELSYEIVGCAFELFKEVSSGHKESVYQKGMAVAITKKNIAFKEQVYYPVRFQGKTIGKNYFDFLVDEKIVVEIKKDFHF